MTNKEYAEIGKWIINNLNDLVDGKHRGIAVVCPLLDPETGGLTRITIEMPTHLYYKREFNKDGSMKSVVVHQTWIPDKQCFVDNKYVYKSKNKS